jgi:hypothetical protein
MRESTNYAGFLVGKTCVKSKVDSYIKGSIQMDRNLARRRRVKLLIQRPQPFGATVTFDVCARGSLNHYAP